MKQHIGFEPVCLLGCAAAANVLITEKELFAYEQAVDYYGEDRVSIQKNTLPVEGLDNPQYNKRKRVDNMRVRTTVPAPLYDGCLTLKEALFSVMAHEETIYSLFIHWPEVTITNENDNSIVVNNLFVRVPLSYDGLAFRDTEPFTVLKTTFTQTQWNVGYIHSHVREFQGFKFSHMCLGSGPIRGTIRKLKDFPTDEMMAKLFFWELDKVIHVESLAGVPYLRMASVQDRASQTIKDISLLGYGTMSSPGLGRKCIKDFLSSFFQAEEIPMSFSNGNYTLAMSFLDFSILITNYYLKWEKTLHDAVNQGAKAPSYASFLSIPIREFIIRDGKLYNANSVRRSSRVPESGVFIFKGKPFPFEIVGNEIRVQKVKLVDLGFVASVIDYIQTTINMATTYEYEEEQQKTKRQIDCEQSNSLISGISGAAWVTGSTSAID